MTRRVLLHVGTPKTGTSYLQDVLFRNRRLLGEHGILYAADRFDAVRYGHEPALEGDARAVVALDDRLGRTRPELPGVVASA